MPPLKMAAVLVVDILRWGSLSYSPNSADGRKKLVHSFLSEGASTRRLPKKLGVCPGGCARLHVAFFTSFAKQAASIRFFVLSERIEIACDSLTCDNPFNRSEEEMHCHNGIGTCCIRVVLALCVYVLPWLSWQQRSTFRVWSGQSTGWRLCESRSISKRAALTTLVTVASLRFRHRRG